MVPAGGLEPPQPKPTDFESVVSTIPPRWHKYVGSEIIVIFYLKVNNILPICFEDGTLIARILKNGGLLCV